MGVCALFDGVILLTAKNVDEEEQLKKARFFSPKEWDAAVLAV